MTQDAFRFLKNYTGLFESLVDLAPVGIFITDSIGDCLFVNKYWLELSELTFDEALGSGWAQALFPDDKDFIFNQWHTAAKQKKEFEFSFRFLSKQSRKTVWVNFRARPVIEPNSGNIQYYIGTVHDLSHVKNLSSEAENSRRFLDSIIENIPHMVFVKEADSLRFIRFNKAGEELIGVSKSEIIGKSDFDLFPKEQAEAFTKKDREVLQGDRLAIVEEEPVHSKSKGLRWLRTKKLPLKDIFGNNKYLLGISEDVTDAKLINSKLDEARKSAEEATKLKTQFLANMSHEIRTPMNGIIGMAEALLDTDLSSEQLENIKALRFSAKSLLQILNDILDVSKIEAGKIDINNKPFNTNEMISSLMTIFKETTKERQVKLTFKTSETVPHFIVADELRLKQVLTNLISNAIKFTPNGGQVLVKTSVKDKKGTNCKLLFKIEDTGIGIPEDKLKQIFAPFVQADSSITRNYGGTGLGLTITQELVQLMDGEISVESKMGVGSTFIFWIPAEVCTEESSKGVLEQHSDYNSKLHNLKMKVLLAEDNSINQKVARKFLEKLGCTVVVAPHGAEAVSIFRDNTLDLILMDIQMPIMDGITATQTIRKLEETRGTRIPIIAMTAHTLKGDKERFLAAGMDDYLSKPLDRDEIIQTLSRYTPTPLVKNERSISGRYRIVSTE